MNHSKPQDLVVSKDKLLTLIQKYNLEESIEGLSTLYSSLEKLEEQYDEKVFAKLYTHAFLETVDTFRKEIEKTN